MFFYSIFIQLYGIGIKTAAWFSPKARLWVAGRKNYFDRYRKTATELTGCIWMHCASLGEFEQGRPLLEMIRERQPEKKILLTFFSPSGYEQCKNYTKADLVAYLPLDTRRNAGQFLDLFRPEKIIFIKYEFWHHVLQSAGRKNIPAYLVSGSFRRDQYFFRWYGKPFRKTLKSFTHLFIQDKRSAETLEQHGFTNYTIAGDTRTDRVIKIAAEPYRDEVIETFLEGKKAIIFGSSWPEEENILAAILPEITDEKIILAPHDTGAKHIAAIEDQFKDLVIKHSSFQPGTDARILLVDSIGILNKLYRYGWITCIGGGFGKGIHNTLEPAAYNLPVIFGPNYLKFREAVQLVQQKAFFTGNSANEFLNILKSLQNNNIKLSEIQNILTSYIHLNKGSSDLVYNYIFNINN